MTRYLFDVDTGIDDALAIMFAVLLGVDVVGMGVVGGNASLPRCVDNTFKVLELLGRQDIPVAAGADVAMVGTPFNDAAHVQGKDALGECTGPMLGRAPSPEPASDQMIRLSKTLDDLVLVATAPLTNVALALQKDPGLAERVGHIVLMGGAVECPGNVTPVAEANFSNDPEAAEIVMSAGWRVTVVPLDQTTRVVFDRPALGRLRAVRTDTAQFAADILEFYVTSYENRGRPGCYLHDPLAVGLALDPTIAAGLRYLPARVSTCGITRGMLVTDRRSNGPGTDWPVVEVPWDIDAELFLNRFEEVIGHR